MTCRKGGDDIYTTRVVGVDIRRRGKVCMVTGDQVVSILGRLSDSLHFIVVDPSNI